MKASTTCVKAFNAQDSRDREFLSWLRANGAQFEHLEWPSRNTERNVRGATARKEISTEEHIVVIPQRLMMSEVHARGDPDLGHVYRNNLPILKYDNGLAVYVMQEIVKGERSFYAPYLRVLPEPRNLRHWGDSSLIELQNPNLARRSAARRRHLHLLYERTFEVLDTEYPGLFLRNRYTFNLFDFAWSTIQARAFGKRLAFSALVPLADCLNHGNVQTKYDFDMESNGLFRLFPSGENHYPKGAEVLNSYGRRSNDNLLLEYGFAMLDNEWDEVEVSLNLPSWEPMFDRIQAILRDSGQCTSRVFSLRRDDWAVEMLHFQRCVCLTTSELDCLEIKRACDAHSPEAAAGIDRVGDKSTSHSEETRVPEENLKALEGGGEGGEGGDKAGGANPTNEMYEKFPSKALFCKNEIAALTELILKLQEMLDSYPTRAEDDKSSLEAQDGRNPDLESALAYRLTAKRILQRQRRMVQLAIDFVQEIEKELEIAADDDKSDGELSSRCSIPEERVPPAFVSYLAELKITLLSPRAAAVE